METLLDHKAINPQLVKIITKKDSFTRKFERNKLISKEKYKPKCPYFWKRIIMKTYYIRIQLRQS